VLAFYRVSWPDHRLVSAAQAWHLASMATHDDQTCEAKIQAVWHSIGVTEAKGVHVVAPKRCPSCHGAVVLSGSYVEAQIMGCYRVGAFLTYS
jgi:hypothetical protein